MNKIIRNLSSFSGGLLGLAIALIALFWILNVVAKRAPAPVGHFASNVESLANGSYYQ